MNYIITSSTEKIHIFKGIASTIFMWRETKMNNIEGKSKKEQLQDTNNLHSKNSKN